MRARRARGLALLAAAAATGLHCGDGSPGSTGQGQPGAGRAEAWFAEVARERGIVFRHRSGRTGDSFFLPEIMGAGGALFDMDADGDLDAYLIQSGPIRATAAERPANQLFRNRGDGTFEDVTAGSGADDRHYGVGVAAGDYDRDGDVDLYLTNLGPDSLLRNEGGGRFSDQTAAAGLGHDGWGSSAAFFDFDRDGDLDLFVATYLHWSVETDRECRNQRGERDFCSPGSYKSPTADVFYRNEGDGTFRDVTRELGVDRALGNSLGVLAADFDGNGWHDVFVVNDTNLNHLWINEAGRRFTENALIAGLASDLEGLAKAGMGVAAQDVDDDADLDVLVCNLVDQSDSFFRNDGKYFSDQTATVGLGGVSRRYTRFGVGLVDFDNDGYLDLYVANGRVYTEGELLADDPYAEPNLLFRGLPGGRFEEQLPRGGVAEPLVATSRAAIFGDVDNDGGVDVLVTNVDHEPHLLRNVVSGRGNWLLFRVLDRHGGDAEGASLTLRLGARSIRRDVRTAYSYLAASDPRVHVGLGAATRVDEVEVRWVDGGTDRFGPFEAGRIVTLRRP